LANGEKDKQSQPNGNDQKLCCQWTKHINPFKNGFAAKTLWLIAIQKRQNRRGMGAVSKSRIVGCS